MSKILDTVYDGYDVVEKGFSKTITGVYQVYKGTLKVLTSPSLPLADVLSSEEEVISGFTSLSTTYTPTTPTTEIKVSMVFNSSNSIFEEGESYIVLFKTYLQDDAGGITCEPLKIQVQVV